MKATELRIGNLADVNGKVVKIESISDLTVSVSGYREDGGETTIRLKNLEPIPLTEEWFMKFGFKKWKDKKMWSYKNVIIYLHSKHGFCFGRVHSRTHLKNVHQLQNLYHALKCEELILKQ